MLCVGSHIGLQEHEGKIFFADDTVKSMIEAKDTNYRKNIRGNIMPAIKPFSTSIQRAFELLSYFLGAFQFYIAKCDCTLAPTILQKSGARTFNGNATRSRYFLPDKSDVFKKSGT